MKKLMIATAAAALAGAGFAEGVVYDMALNVKTTKAVNGKVSDKCGCYNGSVYRKQASYKVQGLFWGCDCYLPAAVLVDRDPLSGMFASGEGNYIFWNVTDKGVWADDTGYIEQDFAWNLLGRIGNKAAECEGAWTLTIGDLALMGAGFGKVDGCEESSIVKTMNGNFAGYWNPGQGCLRCADNAIGYWPLCECGEEDGLTAAYGTWTLKYNSSATSKFVKGQDFFKFPAYVTPAIAQFVAGSDDPTDPTAEKKAIYEKAKAAYEQAKADFESSYQANWDMIAGATAATANVAPAHVAPSWTTQTVGGRVFEVPNGGASWTFAMAKANEAFEIETDQTALDTKAYTDTLNKLTLPPYNVPELANTAGSAGRVAATAGSIAAGDGWAAHPTAGANGPIELYRQEVTRRRNLEADLKNAEFALSIKRSIDYTKNLTTANDQDNNPQYVNAPGTAAGVTTAKNNLVIYYSMSHVEGANDKVDDLKFARQILIDQITAAVTAGTLTEAQAADARKIVDDYDAAMAEVAAKKAAWDDAINERAKICAGMTTAEETAKRKECAEKQAAAQELVTVKQLEMAAAKANCGSACD